MREFIENNIKGFVGEYKKINKTTTDWEEPLIAFANAQDPLFFQLREIISPSHALPGELIGDAKVVVAYFIPFKKEVNLSNVNHGESSKEWAIAYIETNKLIVGLNQYLHEKLVKMNYN